MKKIVLTMALIVFLMLHNSKKMGESSNNFNDMSIPRGIRNNNPINIRLTGITWKGKIPNTKNSDKVFEQFESMEMGIRAGMINMRTHISRGADTLEKLITKHAPPSDNNPTERFIQYVSSFSGIGRSEKLSVKDSRFPKLFYAVVYFENKRDINLNFLQRVHAKYIA